MDKARVRYGVTLVGKLPPTARVVYFKQTPRLDLKPTSCRIFRSRSVYRHLRVVRNGKRVPGYFCKANLAATSCLNWQVDVRKSPEGLLKVVSSGTAFPPAHRWFLEVTAAVVDGH